jgi:serine/threonine-protein kinase
VPDPVSRLNAALAGRYVVERVLGEGGMATVYLARDLKHERQVAVKVLKPDLAAAVGAERFLAEIKTTANLQHPLILPLFDSGEAGGFLYYVMPYVEGESLRQRLDRKGQLPVDEAVRIASGIAAALDYAHRNGVIHRDIKPGNVLFEDGEPVVADFGVALAVGGAGESRLTETGLGIGTPRYMSPEQATGERTVGEPTDIYALGCVLYELLTGEPPFTGRTPQAILGKIIASQPVSVASRRTAVPPNVDATVSRALEKLPADRFGTAREFAEALADPGFRHGEARETRNGTAEVFWRRVSAVTVPVTVVLAAALVWTSWGAGEGAPSVRRLPLASLAENHRVLSGFSLGPRETGFVYRAEDGLVWYRRWDELTPRPVPGSAGGTMVLSHDGAHLLQGPAGGIRVIPLEGGAPRERTMPALWVPRWGGDGYIYYRSGTDRTIHRVSESLDGEVERLGIEPVAEERTQMDFYMLPGGRTGVLDVLLRDGSRRLDGFDLETGRRTVLAEGFQPRPTPVGYLVYGASEGRIMAATLDPRTLEMGTPVEVVSGVYNWVLSWDGTLGYWEAEGTSTRRFELVWVTRAGVASPAYAGWSFTPAASYRNWALSPDERRVVVRLQVGGEEDFWVKDLETGSETRITRSEESERHPRWASDSTIVLMSRMRTGSGHPFEAFLVRADGTGEPTVLYSPHEGVTPSKAILDPAGVWLVLRTYSADESLGGRDILMQRIGTREAPRPILANPDHAEAGPALSPDGRWLAYVSDESGRDEVSVRPFPDVHRARFPVSTDGGIAPVWSRDGRELFFVSPDRKMMAARLSTDPGFRVLSVEELFEIGDEYVGTYSNPFANVADDGRFLMMRSLPMQSRLILVENWFEELERLVPR